jgi:hypothetical protein
MHMAPRAAAWVAWVAWICNCRSNGSFNQERAGFAVRSFFLSGRLLAYDGAIVEFVRTFFTANDKLHSQT